MIRSAAIWAGCAVVVVGGAILVAGLLWIDRLEMKGKK